MDKRLLQIFLSHRSENPGPGIFEVSTDQQFNLYCTCPGYASKDKCKHTRLVGSRMKDNGGVYPFKFKKELTHSDVDIAMASEDAFRKLVIKYGTIEVY